ncbi:MAG: hypothetical protein ACXAB7_05990 [Candidatus Kariarchaeaceae archaeon]
MCPQQLKKPRDDKNMSNTAWAWPWWTFMVIINIVNLVICALVYKRSLLPRMERIHHIGTGCELWG